MDVRSRSTPKNKEKKQLLTSRKKCSENMQPKKAKLNEIEVSNSAQENYISDDVEVLLNKKKKKLRKLPKKLQHSSKEKDEHLAVIMRKTLTINITRLEICESLHQCVDIKSEPESCDEPEICDEINETTNRPGIHKSEYRSDESSETKEFQHIMDLVENKVKIEESAITNKNTGSELSEFQDTEDVKVSNNKAKIDKQTKKKKSVKSKTKMDLMNGIIKGKRSELKISKDNAYSANFGSEDFISSDNESEQTEDSPRICYYKLLAFLNHLEAKEHSNTQQDNVNLCKKIMNSHSSFTRFSSNLLVVSAIKQSLFARKWNNVTRLLMILIQRFTPRYSVYIRTVMQIIKLLNPIIQNSTLGSDIDTIAKSALKFRGIDVDNIV